LYRLDATGWSTLSGEIDAGTFACGAFDSRRGEFLVVGAGAVVVALDGGTRRFQGAGCPLAFDSVRRKWVSFSTNRIDEFDSYASHSNLVTETSGSAALPGSGGFLSARVDLQFGGEGLDDAGAALPGARVWVEGGPQASNVATSTAPMSASFIIDPALVDDAGVAFSTSGRLRIAAQSLGVTGEGSANVELTSLKVVYRVRH
jgi:hypothetical protein